MKILCFTRRSLFFKMLFKILKLLLTICKKKKMRASSIKWILDWKIDWEFNMTFLCWFFLPEYFTTANVHMHMGIGASCRSDKNFDVRSGSYTTCTTDPFNLRSCNLRRTKYCAIFWLTNPFFTDSVKIHVIRTIKCFRQFTTDICTFLPPIFFATVIPTTLS